MHGSRFPTGHASHVFATNRSDGVDLSSRNSAAAVYQRKHVFEDLPCLTLPSYQSRPSCRRDSMWEWRRTSTTFGVSPFLICSSASTSSFGFTHTCARQVLAAQHSGCSNSALSQSSTGHVGDSKACPPASEPARDRLSAQASRRSKGDVDRACACDRDAESEPPFSILELGMARSSESPPEAKTSVRVRVERPTDAIDVHWWAK